MLPATICEIIRGYRDGAFSPVDVIDAALRQIERLEPGLNTFVHLDAADRLRDAARRSALRWQKGEPAGALDGVPFTVKDSIRATDWPTRSGSLTTSPAPGDLDAPAVARIREAHAILLGKTTTPELGWKTVTDSPLTGITRNPWNPDLTPGGSSGGSAAGVAAGMAAASLGTDAAGSVRIPSAFCGLVGLKATRGRIPAFPPSSLWTLGHIGPITRSVRDAALMLNILSEPDPRDWNALPPPDSDFRSSLDALDGDLRGLRIAFSPTLGHAKVDPEVADLVVGAVRRLEQRGAAVEIIEAPLPDAREGFRTYFATGISHGLRAHRPEQIAQLDPGLAAMLEEGKRVTRLQFLEAYDFQIRLSREARLLHQKFDLLVTPTCAVPPFAAGRIAPEGYGHWLDWAAFTYPFNMTGQPALSLCCGYTADGLPVGIQIVGAMYAEPTVLRTAHALEVETPSRACPSRSAAQ